MKIKLLAAIISIDLISKFLITQYLPTNFIYPINNFFDIVHIHNRGISFGLFENILSNFFILLIVFLILIILFIWLFRSKENLEKWALTFILAGGICNFIDRLINGYVVDFISLHYKDFYWPAFNFADISITFGVFILIFSTYINYKYRIRNNNE